MTYEMELYHHGVKGMKWGIRKYQYADGSLTPKGRKRYQNVTTVRSKKTGDAIHINQLRKSQHNNMDYDITANGKKVGHLFLENHGDELYVNWIDIKKTERGKGYASSVMDYVVSVAEKGNYKSLTLEVPVGDDDARHVYEKHGFVAGKTDEYYLTSMRRKIRD